MSQAFDGKTYNPEEDYERLASQLQAVTNIMSDNEWHTLAELHAEVGGSEAAISARVRDLRKPKYGSRTIMRRYVGYGVWEYRMEPDNVKK